MECPVCLGWLRNPVVPPCGHLICEPCIKRYISLSTDYFEARCPTCRASFPNVLADLSLIPNKYHIFINPPLRRVYLEDKTDNNKAVINQLKSKIIFLEARVELLKSDNVCTEREYRLASDKAKEDARLALDEARKEARIDLDRVKADAQVALDEVKHEARLAQAKTNKEARLALDKANKDLHIANSSLKELRKKHDRFKSRVIKSHSVVNTERARKYLPQHVKLPLAGHTSSLGDSGLVSDLRLISAAREALAVLSLSPTPPSVASAPGGSLAQTESNTGSNIPWLATNQATLVTGGSSATSNTTPTLNRSPTPPLLYPSSPTVVSHTGLQSS